MSNDDLRGGTTIGTRIKARREQLGIKPAELARQVGMSRSYIHAVEHDDVENPSAEALSKIANVLDVSFRELLDGTPEPPKRRHVVNIEIGADTTDDILDALKNLQFQFHAYGINSGMSGGVNSNWIIDYRINPDMDHDTYVEDINQWLEENENKQFPT